MKKKFLALVLTLAMVLSLAPVGALATNGEESQTPEDVIYDNTAYRGNATVDGVDSLDKTAKKTGENTYEVKLEVKMHETTSTISQAAATVLVIDVSDSMNDRTCGKKEHTHTNDCYTTEKKCTQAENPDHWVPGLLGVYHHKDGTTCTYKFPYGYFYEIEPTLKCGREEHTHDSSCYPIAAAKEAANSFVDTYAGTVNGANRYLSIVVFGDKASVKLDWTDVSTSNGKNKAKSAIKGLEVDGGTNLEQGLAKAKSKLEEHTVSSVNFKNVVALTDGAPTFYGERPYGSGSSGSETINNQTAETARNLKAIANLYTVCFGAENKKTYWNGPTVGEFLENSIATDSNHAYNADNAGELNKAFEKISQTITSGLSAGTVHDALPTGVTSSAFNGETTADWDLNTFDKQTSDEGNTKHYTYTKTYTVTIDPDKIDTSKLENGYYPLNDRTTLTVKTGDTKTVLDFPIPAGKVTAKITYMLYGGENAASNPETYVCGVGVDRFADATRTGYTFGGWYSDSSYTNKVTTISKTEVGNKTLHAKWEKDNSQTKKLSYTVEYYKDNEKVVGDTQTVTKDVWVNATTLTVDKGAINTTDKYAGYKFDKTEPGTIPNEVTGGTVIKVYYVKDDSKTKKLTYTVEYYKDGQRVDDDTQTVTKDVWVNATKLTVDKDKINTTDKYTSTGYKFDKTEPGTIPNEVTGGTVIKVYYVKDDSKTKKLTYTVEYYKDGQRVDDDTQTVTKDVWVNATKLTVDKDKINTTDKYTSTGYKFDKTEPGTIPNEVTGGTVIKVYYVKDDSKTKKLTYTVEYYKDGQRVDDDTQTVTKDVWVNATKLTVDKDKINTTDKYTGTGYKFDKTEPGTIPNEVTGGTVIKVYYVKDDSKTKKLTYTVEYYKDGQRVDDDTQTVTKDVWVNATKLTVDKDKINTTDKYTGTGYKFDKTEPGTIPNEVTGGTVIKVYYVKDDSKTKKLTYTVEYYKDGQRVDDDTQTVTKDVWVNATKLTVDKDKINTTDKYTGTGYKFDKTEPGTIPNEVTGGTVIKVYYVKDDSKTKKLTYTVEYYKDGQRVDDDTQTVTKDVWVNATKLTVDKDKINTTDKYTSTGYKFDKTEPGTIPNEVTGGTVIKVYYVKDDSKTKKLTYTVEYYKDGQRVDDDTQTVTKDVWVNATKLTVDKDKINTTDKYTGTGYKFDKTEPGTIPNEVTGGTVIKVYYVKDDSKTKKLTYTVEYYKDGQRVDDDTQTVTKDVWVNATKLTVDKDKINTTDKYTGTGYKFDKTEPGTIPNEVTGGTTIKVYYYLDNWKDADETTDSDDKDSETGGDGIPDCYQVLVNYKSGDTNRGSVGPRTMEVLTIKNTEDKWASTGTVKASGSTATATGSRCYFSSWTNDAGVNTSNAPATLGQQTFNAEGGKTYTFTANFDRSSGGGSGGSNRPKPPVVEIPDDVPTGLNGKDHYAYVVGYPDGMVYPQKNITRAEVATIFFRLLKDETREANMTKSNGYNDMKEGAWYTCAVSTLSKMGIIKGYEDGSFKPDASISRAEFAAIAARFDPDGDKTPATFSDVSSHWAKDEISIAANHGWIKGYEDGSFKPDQKITRAETMTLVNRVLKRLPETKDDLHKDMKTWPDNQNESAWFYLAVQEATNSHYQKLKKDGTHETWESMRETRDWAALEK